MRIAIVNDMPLVIEGLIRTIRLHGKYTIAWTAWDGAEAIENCKRDLPDLILMDLLMPGMGGVHTTRYIMKHTPCPILLVTASINQNSDLVFEAMSAGALDVVLTPKVFDIEAMDLQNDNDLLKKINMIWTLTREPHALVSKLPVIKEESQGYKIDGHLVAIGCSSGGPDALARLFSGLKSNTTAAFVVIQHVDEQFAPGLINWLNDRTELTVAMAKSGDRPCAGKVLIAGHNKHLIIKENGLLEYTSSPQDTFYRPSVDVFFYSLLSHWHHPATAILLTGMGKDGARGLLELKKKGFHTIAQDSASSAVYGMPKAAKDLDATCEILSLKDIAQSLQIEYSPNEVSWR